MRFGAPVANAVARYPKTRWVGRAVRDLNLLRWRAAAKARASAPWITSRLLRPSELRLLERYASQDLLVSTGGTYFVERYGIWLKVIEMDVAQALGVPSVFYTQSMGPFKSASNKRAMRRITRRADLVVLRDERSREHLLEIGVPADKIRVAADAVFTYADQSRWRPAPDVPAHVAISVRAWPFAADRGRGYFDALARLTCHLVANGARVTFISTCQGIEEYWTDDGRDAQALADGLPSDVRASVEVERAYHRPEELLDILSGVDLTIATRMHMAILSLSAGTPVLPIAYEFKTQELFGRLGLADHVTTLDGSSGSALVAAYERFWADRHNWSTSLPGAVAAERRLADRAAADVFAVVRPQG